MMLRHSRSIVKLRNRSSPWNRTFTHETADSRFWRGRRGRRGSTSARESVKHLLAPCDANEPADKNRHVGSYATEACMACFDLVPKERFEGHVRRCDPLRAATSDPTTCVASVESPAAPAL